LPPIGIGRQAVRDVGSSPKKDEVLRHVRIDLLHNLGEALAEFFNVWHSVIILA